MRTRVGALLGGVLLLSVTAVLIGGGLAPAGSEGGQQETPTPTQTAEPTPTATPTPSPTPTATPDGPVPADPIAPGEAAGLSNPSSIGLPAPAPSSQTSPPNEAGVVRMVSPSLGIDHYITTLGIANGKMQSPDADGIHAVGWYASDDTYEFGAPGEAGNAIFSAHETWNHLQGPFYNLHKARVGDDIYLDMADGERRHYQVASVTRYPAHSMPMGEVLWPSDRPEYEDWITLYTCGGEIVYDARGYGDYLDRDVLVAKWVGSTDTP